jgi:hypothetical protein
MGVTIKTTRVSANTVTGTQDITTADLGGLVPKAVMLVVTRAVTDDTGVDGAGMYIGLSDGTNELAQGYEDQHAQATMDAEMEQDTTANRILTIYDGTADDVVEGTADFDSFITDGVRINWTDAPASAYLIVATFFAGDDLTAHVGSVSLGNTSNALIAVTSVGFEADVLITLMLEGTTVLAPGVGLGVVHNNRAGTITQRCLGNKQRVTFTTSSPATSMRNDACIVKVQATDALDWYGSAQSFDSSGFDVQLANSRAPGNVHLGWLALRFGASPVVDSKVYTYSSPTATGSHTDSNPGFEPQFVMYLGNMVATANTIEGDADGGTFEVIMADADEVYTQGILSGDNLADSDTASYCDDRVQVIAHTSAAIHLLATLTSMGSTGPVWNYSIVNVSATARQWPALAIEEFVGGGDPEGELVSGGKLTNGGMLLGGFLVGRGS